MRCMDDDSNESYGGAVIREAEEKEDEYKEWRRRRYGNCNPRNEHRSLFIEKRQIISI